jgi:hypothetical protein
VWAHRLEAACLVLFPLLFLALAGTDLHPSPSGETTAEQLRAVAASAGAWQLVHLLLAAASLLGVGAVLGLRRLIPTSGRLSVAASIAAALGVAAAGLVAGIALMEAVLGWMAKTVRPWEALVMVVGVVGIYATNTALHGDAKYGLAFLLVASASIAPRMERSSRHE